MKIFPGHSDADQSPCSMTEFENSLNKDFKVVLGGYPQCQDNHDLSKCHRPDDLGRHLPPISLTVSTLTTKKLSVTSP